MTMVMVGSSSPSSRRRQTTTFLRCWGSRRSTRRQQLPPTWTIAVLLLLVTMMFLLSDDVGGPPSATAALGGGMLVAAAAFVPTTTTTTTRSHIIQHSFGTGGTTRRPATRSTRTTVVTTTTPNVITGGGMMRRLNNNNNHHHHNYRGGFSSSTTALSLSLEEDPVSFILVMLAIGYAQTWRRTRLSNRSWEERIIRDQQRREDAGLDPPRTEFEKYRERISLMPTMYGEGGLLARQREAKRLRQMRQEGGGAEIEEDTDDWNENMDVGGYMSEEQVKRFETVYGVEYDPYYDEPYEEEELPSGEFKVNKAFGDRYYKDGEVFFKDGDLFYRQGGRPRMKFFWQKEYEV